MIKFILIGLILILIYKIINIENVSDIECIYNKYCVIRNFKKKLKEENVNYELKNSLLKMNLVQSVIYNILPGNLKEITHNIYKEQVTEEEFIFNDGGVTNIEYLLSNDKNKPYIYCINTITLDSFYIRKLMLELNIKYNYNCIYIYSRGFKVSINNNITYLSNINSDLDEIFSYLFTKFESDNNILIGVSMGGNSFCRYLCENYENKKKIKCFISIYNPLDLLGLCYAETSSLINNYMIHRYFKLSIKKYLEKNFKNNKKVYKNINYYIENLDDFYINIIKPYSKKKYKSFDDFCYNISCINFIERLNIPSLFIYAKDDYATPISKLNKEKLKKNNNIFQLYTEYGSHTGHYNDDGEIWVIEIINLFINYLNE